MVQSARVNRVTGEITHSGLLRKNFRPLVIIDGHPFRYWEFEITYGLSPKWFSLSPDLDDRPFIAQFQLCKPVTQYQKIRTSANNVSICQRRSGRMVFEISTRV